MKRKSQIQMGETIAILIIFILFVSFGLIFYARMMEQGNQDKREESLELWAVQVAQKASFLPELQCSEENVRKDNCIDLLKITKAAEIFDQRKIDYYYPMFGLANITIIVIFPNDPTDIHLGTDNYVELYTEIPPNDKMLKKESTFIPITLKDYANKKSYFGILSVEVYLSK